MALIDADALLKAVKDEKARRAASQEHIVTTSDLIDIIDTLGTAKTRCAALHMASEALVRDHRDAVSFLANDCDDVINTAIEALQAIVDAAESMPDD